MYVVKADRPPVKFEIVLGQGRDSEGHESPLDSSQLDITAESTNANAVAITLNDERTGGEVSFGDPGDAQVVVTVAKKDGTVLEKLDAGFHVTAGDPASIVGGSLKFDDLTEEPPATGQIAESSSAEQPG